MANLGNTIINGTLKATGKIDASGGIEGVLTGTATENVSAVSVSGSTLTVTKGDGSSSSSTVPRGSTITAGTAITAAGNTTNTPAGSIVGDLYVNNSSWNVYRCTTVSGTTYTWALVGNIKGSTGTGTAGARGSQWWSGTALIANTGTSLSPGSSIGDCRVGDYYLNTSGLVYRCNTAGTGTSSKWEYVGSIKGNTGTTPTISVGTVTTGSAGSNASVTKGGTDSAVTLSFTIPKGDTGATGQRGSKWFTGTAASGTSTCSITLSEKTYVGDMYLDTDSSTVFTCTTAANASAASTWTYSGSIKGGTGSTGATGTSWIVGTALSVTSGTGLTPSANIPVAARVGDLYLNSSSGTFYTCTTAGGANTNASRWSYSGSIKGATGSNASVSMNADQNADYGLLATSLTTGSALTSATRSTKAKINTSTGNITTAGNVTVGSKATMSYNASEDCITFSFI